MDSGKTGRFIGEYREDVVEKVWRLASVLNTLAGHPSLVITLPCQTDFQTMVI